ncbi:uncharacterized protein TNCV_3682721 [Trichonephila clavipes]|uniref:Uncharacterized protein n=1 Tax=Trichonephila clavipes TaxID=2585209 RepID=A0A8X6RHE3_TRICX|nr:uncharacterized protein TNCV_3682721 [Trichonephila clavipes]
MTNSFLQALGSTSVYCYRCPNAGFVNSSTSAALWIACKGAFIQDPPHGKPSTAAFAMSSEPGKLIGTKLSFQINHASICGMPVNAAFQSALCNDIVA